MYKANAQNVLCVSRRELCRVCVLVSHGSDGEEGRSAEEDILVQEASEGEGAADV